MIAAWIEVSSSSRFLSIIRLKERPYNSHMFLMPDSLYSHTNYFSSCDVICGTGVLRFCIILDSDLK